MFLTIGVSPPQKTIVIAHCRKILKTFTLAAVHYQHISHFKMLHRWPLISSIWEHNVNIGIQFSEFILTQYHDFRVTYTDGSKMASSCGAAFYDVLYQIWLGSSLMTAKLLLFLWLSTFYTNLTTPFILI